MQGVARKIDPERPWTVTGSLIRENQVLPDASMLQNLLPNLNTGLELKDANLSEPIELQYLQQVAGEALGRRELVLIPEVIQKFLNPCQVKAYKPDVQWILKDFCVRSSAEELAADWERESSSAVVSVDLTDPESRVRVGDFLQLKEGHRGVRRDIEYVLSCHYEKGIFTFNYYLFQNGSFKAPSMEDANAPYGWHGADSLTDKMALSVSPVLGPRGWSRHNFVRPRSVTAQQLSLPCALAALQREGLTVAEVLGAERLHGHALRLGCDLLLAARDGSSSSLVAVYFHLLQLPFAAKIDALGKDFSDRYLGHAVFMSSLDAAIVQNVTHVLVLWYSDQAMTLRWYLSPIPAAFRDFRCRLAAAWLPNSEERIERFNKLLRSEISQVAMQPLLVELPKDTCSNVLCKAGQSCTKHFHLFQVPFVPRCELRELCAMNKKIHQRCPWHHCKPLRNGAPLAPPGCCVQLRQLDATAEPWKPKEKPLKDKQAKARGTETKAGDTGLYAVQKFLEAVRFSNA